MTGVRRRGRKESRPGHGSLLQVPANAEKARFIKSIGPAVDIALCDQLEIDYVRLAAFEPIYPVCEWNKKPDPTPEEIRERGAVIRETWDRHRWSKEDMRKEAEFPVINMREIGL